MCLFQSFTGWFQALIERNEGVPAEDLVVYSSGKPLDSGASLAAMENLATLDIEVRVLGGKMLSDQPKDLYLLAKLMKQVQVQVQYSLLTQKKVHIWWHNIVELHIFNT